MTDLDAIRADNERDLIGLAEHPEAYATHDKKFIRDTAIVLAALSSETMARRQLRMSLDAAIEREARLRAALNAISNNVLTDPRAAARAALATEDER